MKYIVYKKIMHYVHLGVYHNVFNVRKIYKCHSPCSHMTRNTT